MPETKKLSDVLPKTEAYPELEKLEREKLLQKTFTIKEVTEFTGEHGLFYVCKIGFSGQEYSTSFGSSVINEKITKIKDQLPIEATMVEKKSKSGRIYHDLE